MWRFLLWQFYPNTMDGNLEKRAANIEHLYKVTMQSKKLGINLVTTFIGRDQTKTVEENLELVKKIWIPIVRYAEGKESSYCNRKLPDAL